MMREDKLGTVLCGGASPAGVTSAPGRGWGDVPTVGPDAGAGKRVGPRGPRSSKGGGATIWSVQFSDWPDQGGASEVATAIARAGERTAGLNCPAVVDTGWCCH